jgi:hypothetical protein
VDTAANPLRLHRVPGSVEEARTLLAYNQRIVATSQSPQRRHRAERMLVNLQPELARLERDELERMRRIETSAPPTASFDGRVQEWRDNKRDDEPEYETVWHGGEGLSSYRRS